MEAFLNFNYFHIIVDEVALILSEKPLLFLGYGVRVLAGEHEKQREQRDE